MKDYNPKKQASVAYVAMKENYMLLKKELKEGDSKYLELMNEFLVSNPKLSKKNEERQERHQFDKNVIRKKYSGILKEVKQKGGGNKEEINTIRKQRDAELNDLHQSYLKTIIDEVEANISKDSDVGKEYNKIKKQLQELHKNIEKTDVFFEEIHQKAKDILPAEAWNKKRVKKQPKKAIKKEEKEVIPLEV